MSAEFLSVGPGHTLRQVARMMAERNVGAAVVLDPDGEGPGIITERDILRSIAAGEDPDAETVADHLTPDVTVADVGASMEWAAQTMLSGGFRHLVVVGEDGDAHGMLSIRDVLRRLVAGG